MARQRNFQTLVSSLMLLLTAFPSPQALDLTSGKISTVDLAALEAIRNSLIDVPGTPPFFSTWDFTHPDPCTSFSGITCDSGGRVTILTLGTGLSNSRGLTGSLSAALANLTELTQLILFPGLVTGPIPPDVGRLSNLRVMSLTKNRLTGPIPGLLSNLRSLHTLDLSGNELSGSVPAGLAGLPQLKVLVLASNKLTGELNRGQISSPLLHVDLKNNEITGTLPDSLPSTLRYLSLAQNSMWGPIAAVEPLRELVYLELSGNKFTGDIPSSLFFRTGLSTLLLRRNNFSGEVPLRRSVEDGSLGGEGSVVDLSYNSLAGQLSPVLAGVETLFLNNNRFTGRVPEEYVKSLNSGTTTTLYLQHNFITEFPWVSGTVLPHAVSVCLSYNCMLPPHEVSTCPANAGDQLARPASQCS